MWVAKNQRAEKVGLSVCPWKKKELKKAAASCFEKNEYSLRSIHVLPQIASSCSSILFRICQSISTDKSHSTEKSQENLPDSGSEVIIFLSNQ
jgi:hypothetical protein